MKSDRCLHIDIFKERERKPLGHNYHVHLLSWPWRPSHWLRNDAIVFVCKQKSRSPALAGIIKGSIHRSANMLPSSLGRKDFFPNNSTCITSFHIHLYYWLRHSPVLLPLLVVTFTCITGSSIPLFATFTCIIGCDIHLYYWLQHSPVAAFTCITVCNIHLYYWLKHSPVLLVVATFTCLRRSLVLLVATFTCYWLRHSPVLLVATFTCVLLVATFTCITGCDIHLYYWLRQSPVLLVATFIWITGCDIHLHYWLRHEPVLLAPTFHRSFYKYTIVSPCIP